MKATREVRPAPTLLCYLVFYQTVTLSDFAVAAHPMLGLYGLYPDATQLTDRTPTGIAVPVGVCLS